MSVLNSNPILDVDSYKSSHYLQYPPGTKRVFSYLESRPGGLFDRVLFFGLQYILQEYFSEPVTQAHVEEAKDFMKLHGEPFPYEEWTSLIKKCNGRLPLKIRAAPEGEVIPTGNVLMTVENTAYEFPWLVNWFETKLMRVWYPITVATVSWHAKKVILESLMKTSDDPWGEIYFKLHDFGSRGVSSKESAAIGGAAHLVNFMGSDTVAGVLLANKVYHTDMSAFSIPAMEHSTVTSWVTDQGLPRERDAYANMIDKCVEKGFKLMACVSDSYDLMDALDNIWGNELKQKVIESGATIVIRPDSGNPREIVRMTLQKLDKHFGSTINKKGYKVLNHVRVLQGDGIDSVDSIANILSGVELAGFSATNVAFGMGGGLLQKVNRDTQRFAFKASEILLNNHIQPIGKNPKTDPTKASKKGHLDLLRTAPHEFKTVYDGEHWDSALTTVFFEGNVFGTGTLLQIRKRSDEALKEYYK